GILQAIKSELLEKNIAAKYRDPENFWYGLSMRARIIAVSKSYPNPENLSYADLAKPEWKGKVLMRSSDNIYNQSLVAGIIAHVGEDSAQKWVDAVHANFAREPKGGDTDQIRAIAAGEGEITVANSYYIGKMARSEEALDKEALAAVNLVFPKDVNMNTHVNISASGVVKYAPHKENAVKLLEFMSRPENQALFFEHNQEYTVAQTVPEQKNFDALGTLTPDTLALGTLGIYQPKAVSLFEKTGWM
ncbi:MAG: extracellular solute-binding protein, partial [Luteibaculum sp.]